MTSGRASHRSVDRVFQALAVGSRREILSFLLDRSTPASEQAVVAHVRAQTRKQSTSGGNSIRTQLVHTHLPILDDAGLIQWDRDGAVVNSAPHPAFDDPRFPLLLEAKADGLDVALANLSIERRRIVLTILRDARKSITRRDLARELLRTEDIDIDSPSKAVDDELTSLYHVHLPALADAGLIEYDPDTTRATYTGHPALEEIFTIIYEPEEQLLDSCDGFLEGMNAAFDELKQGTGTEVEWPHFWRNPSHE